MNTIWVLVADTTRARMLAAHGGDGELVEQVTLLNPAARMHERELTSDLSGRAVNSATGMSTTFGKDEKHKPHALRQFAHAVAERLALERNQGSYERLYVIAEPAFLGQLRLALDAQTEALIAGEINRNLTRVPLEQVRDALPERL